MLMKKMLFNIKEKIYNNYCFIILLSFLYSTLFSVYYIISRPETITGYFYAFIYSLGHGFEFAFILFVSYMFFVFLNKKISSVIYILLSLGVSIYIIVDIIIYRQFKYNLNLTMLQLFFGPASKDIFEFNIAIYIQFVFVVLTVLCLIVGIYIFSQKEIFKKRTNLVKIFSAIFILSVISYHIIHGYAAFKNDIRIMNTAYRLPLSYPFSMNKLLNSYGYKPAESGQFDIVIKELNYPLHFPIIDKNYPKYNIIFIGIDSWRADCENEDITPNIETFAKENIRFMNHNANANQTRYGIFSLFYALAGSYWDIMLHTKTPPVFIDLLQKENYNLGIYASASLNSPEFSRTIFSKVDNLRIETKTKDGKASSRDLSITNEFISFLDDQSKDKPFFAFLFYDSPHAYDFNESIYPAKYKPYGTKNYISVTNSDKERIFNQYKNAVGYTDLLVGRVLDELKAKGFYENSIIIITGDHGEEFNDLNQGYWGHFGNYSKYQVNVPLLVKFPNRDEKEVSYITSHVDIVPTIIRYGFLSSTPYEDYSLGSDLFNKDGRDYIYMKGEEYAILNNNLTTIFKKFGLYEVRDENYNIADKKLDSSLLNKLLKDLSRFRAQ